MSQDTVLKLARLLYNTYNGLENKDTIGFKNLNNDQRKPWTQKAQEIIDMLDDSVDSDE